MSKNISSFEMGKCYGCTACSSVCPQNAIEMKRNENGFYSPVLNSEKCIECGLCVKACQIGKENSLKTNDISCFGLKNKNDNERLVSTSGGAFSLIANYCLKSQYKICACTIKEKKVQHVFSDDYALFRGSKYVQSDLNDSFLRILNLLRKGNGVLFVGTPCQCAGLKNYLATQKVDLTKLVLVDFICHGTPSPGLFEDYVSYVEKTDKKILVDHKFRTKYNNWNSHVEENIFSDGYRDHESFHSQIFRAVFCSRYAFRESCYQCGYSTQNRASDITLADFWGIDQSHSDFFDKNGVSFVMVNSPKGMSIFTTLENDADIIAVKPEDTAQPQLYGSVAKPSGYDDFWDCYHKHGFEKLSARYFAAGKFRRFLSRIYRTLRRG